jgi:hypothetical protein
MSYALKYFRDAEIVAWYRKHGIDKSVGWVFSTRRYDTQERAQRDADHINALGPSVPVTVVLAIGRS